MIPARPIRLDVDSVCAILTGNQTQTRRVVKHIPMLGAPEDWCHRVGTPEFERIVGDYTRYSPYGQPGGQLWVREAWRPEELPSSGIDGIRYLADNTFIPIPNTEQAGNLWSDAYHPSGPVWRPPNHMPRWASRITLEITGVRVEQLHEISLQDILDEGLAKTIHQFKPVTAGFKAFEQHWDAQNKNPDTSWIKNPWVWRITFKTLKGPTHE